MPTQCPVVDGTGSNVLPGWTNWPPICSVSPAASGTPPAGSGTTDINSFYFVDQLWHAVRERNAILAGETFSYWPPEATAWGTGFIFAVTQPSTNRIRFYDTAISGGAPGVSGWIDSTGGKKWFNAQTFNGADAPWMPQSFKIVLDRNNGYDPSAVTIYDIVDNGTNWVEIVDDGTPTMNRSLGSYIGKAYAIHGQDCTYVRPVWAQRWPQRPNSPPEREWGAISLYASGTIYDNTTETSDSWPLGPKNWTVNQWAGKQLIALTGSKWTRYSISSNTANTINISPAPGISDPQPTSEYWIVENGAYWRPKYALRLDRFIDKSGRYNLMRRQGSAPWALFEWYKGLMRSYWSHDPVTGGVRAATVIDTDISIIEGEAEDFCEEQYHNDIRDNLDFHISPTDECNSCPDGYINPWIYQTIRGIQASLESIAGYFVAKKDYTNGVAIPGLTPATMFQNMGVNYAVGTVGNVIEYAPVCVASGLDEETGWYCTEYANPASTVSITWDRTLPKYPIEVHWTLLDGDTEDVTAYGYIHSGSPASNYAGTADTNTITVDYAWGSGNIGDSVVISWGWTRKHPKEFKYMYRSDWFVPDTGENGGLVFPPTAEYPGYYDTRPASSQYVAVDDNGFSREDGPAFANGDAARFIGDNWHDPSTEIEVGEAASRWLAEYFNKAAVATPGYNSQLFKIVKIGTITSGDAWGFKDDYSNVGRTWWETTGFTHTGSGLAGGSTTLLKDYKYDTVTSGLNGFWASMGGQRFVNMMLDVEVNPSSHPNVYESRPIIAQDIGAGTGPVSLTVQYAFSNTTVGKRYRIREPGYLLNRFRDRVVKIIKPDESTFNINAVWNDDKSIWTSGVAAFNFQPGWKYEIVDPRPGGVWHRVSNKWYPPKESGIVPQDTRGRNWHQLASENLPHCYTVPGDDTGGRLRKGDYINCTLLMELYQCINSMVWTREDVTWRGDFDNVVDASGNLEFNQREMSIFTYTGPAPGSPPPDTTGPNADWCGEDCWCDGQIEKGNYFWDTSPGYAGEEITHVDGSPYAYCAIYGHLDTVGYLTYGRRYSYAVISPGCGYHHDDGSPMSRKVSIWAKPWVTQFINYSQNVEDLNCDTICYQCGTYYDACGSNWGIVKFKTHGDFLPGITTVDTWGEMVTDAIPNFQYENVVRVGTLTIDGNFPINWYSSTTRPEEPTCPPLWPGDCESTCPSGIYGHVGFPLWWSSAVREGYVIHDDMALVKWNVPNGLRFVDEVE